MVLSSQWLERWGPMFGEKSVMERRMRKRSLPGSHPHLLPNMFSFIRRRFVFASVTVTGLVWMLSPDLMRQLY